MSNQKAKANPKSGVELPPIPEKLYFTIGEVSRLCALRPHVLRYWEQEFNQLSPTKRRGNRRYYQLRDVLLVRKIRTLLYEEGYTIEGARLKLSGESAKNDPQQKTQLALRTAINELEKMAAELTS